MKKHTLFTILFAVFFHTIYTQSQIAYEAIETAGYGVWAHGSGHTIPLPVCGFNVAYNQLESAEQYSGSYTAGLRFKAGSTVGFSNFITELGNNGYSLNDVIMVFQGCNLNSDVEGIDWFVSGDTESRFYRNGTFEIQVDGYTLFNGFMPDFQLIIDYNTFGNCTDDVISGNTGYVEPFLATGNPPEIENIAFAFMDDLGFNGMRLAFSSIQPASQGSPPGGGIFESPEGLIQSGNVPIEYNYPSSTIISNVHNTCIQVDGSVNSTGSQTWLHITHNGNMVASIYDSEALGQITTQFFINSGTVRNQNGVEILDRDFQITPATQPNGTIRVRFYFTAAELLAFLSANDGDGNDISQLADLSFTRFSGGTCNNHAGTTFHHPVVQVGKFGDDYYVDIETTGFSSFLGHGGGAPLALPVELSHFSGELLDDKIELVWETKSELNNAGFEIERAIDQATLWESIAWVTGHGTSNSQQYYYYKDKTIEKGATYYYRLKQIDHDGKFEYSNILSFQTPNEDNIVIYPNPVESVLSIKFTEDLDTSQSIEIYNTMGKKLLSHPVLSSSENIDFQRFTSGVYFIHIRKASGELVYLERVIRP